MLICLVVSYFCVDSGVYFSKIILWLEDIASKEQYPSQFRAVFSFMSIYLRQINKNKFICPLSKPSPLFLWISFLRVIVHGRTIWYVFTIYYLASRVRKNVLFSLVPIWAILPPPIIRKLYFECVNQDSPYVEISTYGLIITGNGDVKNTHKQQRPLFNVCY